MNEEKKHSLLSRMAYGAADIYGGGAFVVISTFYTVFLTKAQGMPAAMAGTIPLIGKVWDAVTDPIMGNICDRTKSKFGAKRFYILVGSLLSALTFILMWITAPFATMTSKYVFYAAMYMLFSTGFTVNSGVIPAIVGRGDYLICDDRDHASIVDGRRLSFATQLHYKHNDMEDLERVLKRLPHEAIKLIVVDGVFSMEGDLAKLPEIVELKHKYNCSIMVDEAHGLGVFGDQGRGVCHHFGLQDDVDIIMGTFSKSLASIGGFVAADWDIINYLRHTARTYIFSASDTPAATACALEALHIIQNEPERRQRLWDVTNYALKRFREEGFEIGETESPIIPLYVRDDTKTFLVTKLAFDAGVFINPVIPPACAPQDTLVRFALMATHTKEQVERGVMALKKIFVDQGIIK